MKRYNTKSMVILALLTAIIVLMAFTPLGYLPVGVLKITLNMIPVAVGAIALGPAGGAFLGCVFGITSFAQCFGTDAFGTILAGYSVFGAFAVCVLARALAGFLTGLVFKLLSGKLKTDYLLYPIVGLSASVFNTVLFMSSLMAIFGRVDEIVQMRGDMDLIAFMCAFVGVNAIFEIIACTVASGAVGAALKKARLIGTAGKAKVNAAS
ncbi:MAG: ECF transporter S component [Ruminococcus sp.]|nr:ECF transporter S component [Ruminococcus sp.]